MEHFINSTNKNQGTGRVKAPRQGHFQEFLSFCRYFVNYLKYFNIGFLIDVSKSNKLTSEQELILYAPFGEINNMYLPDLSALEKAILQNGGFQWGRNLGFDCPRCGERTAIFYTKDRVWGCESCGKGGGWIQLVKHFDVKGVGRG